MQVSTSSAFKYKLAQEEKENSHLDLEAIFGSMQDAILTVNKDSVVIALNKKAMALFECSISAIGKPFSTLSKNCNSKCIDILEKILNKRSLVVAEKIEWNSASQGKKNLSVRTYPLLRQKELQEGVVMVIRDEHYVADYEPMINEQRQFRHIVGKSDPMQKIFSLIRALAPVETTVLITGESGTGKELVAEALHNTGKRSHKPLVKVNCSALPESLFESELFGFKKGSFTDATRNMEGRFNRAHGGTIFFDEIADISPNIQLKLLRVLEEREFEQIGSSIPTKVDVRLVAATNKNLKTAVNIGNFREDLYYRLKVIEIKLPALRDRRDDLPILVDHFRKMFNIKFRKSIEAVSSEVMKAFLKYSWPGNVRELKHTMEHAFILCNQKNITFDHMPPDLLIAPISKVHSTDNANVLELNAIYETLEKTSWNKAKAARMLGIHRATLYRKIKKS